MKKRKSSLVKRIFDDSGYERTYRKFDCNVTLNELNHALNNYRSNPVSHIAMYRS